MILVIHVIEPNIFKILSFECAVNIKQLLRRYLHDILFHTRTLKSGGCFRHLSSEEPHLKFSMPTRVWSPLYRSEGYRFLLLYELAECKSRKYFIVFSILKGSQIIYVLHK